MRCGVVLVLILMAFAMPFSVAAQETGQEFRDDLRLTHDEARRIDAAVQELMQRDAAVGVALGIVRDGEIAYLKGYGLSDAENELPLICETMFRWASVSKILTAIAALQLYEQAMLDLDEDVRQYVPELPDHGQKITARQLLCHESGIVHYTNGRVVKTKQEYDVAHPFVDVIVALDTFKESPLLFSPGEKFSYTTHGYILLSAVIQRAGKQPFRNQIAERIARPTGMTTLQPDYQWEHIQHRAAGYRKLNGEIVPSDDSDVSWKLGGGGYISNIGDMARLAQALINRDLVSRQTESIMWTRQQTRKGMPTNYGLGFAISGDGDERIVSHNGAQPKTRTRLVIFPAKRLGLVVASNSEWVKPSLYTARVREVLEGFEATADPQK